MFPISVSDSHVVGDTSQPLWEETIGAHLARVAATWPEHAALMRKMTPESRNLVTRFVMQNQKEEFDKLLAGEK